MIRQFMTEMAVMKFRAKITESFTTTTREWSVVGGWWSAGLMAQGIQILTS